MKADEKKREGIKLHRKKEKGECPCAAGNIRHGVRNFCGHVFGGGSHIQHGNADKYRRCVHGAHVVQWG